MTDNEIIKALECCIKNTCSECPFYKNWSTHRCGELRNLTLDLIKQLKERDKKNENIIRYADKTIEKQQADIESAIKTIDGLMVGQKTLIEEAKKAKSEAIKEFAERLKRWGQYSDDFNCWAVAVPEIDNLVKEMTESPTKIEHSSLCETDTYEVKE